MNSQSDIERQLHEIGVTLRRRASITARVLVEIDGASVEHRGNQSSVDDHDISALPPYTQSVKSWGRKHLVAGIGTLAAAGVILVCTLLISGSPTSAWAHVVEAVSRQPWIHGTVTYEGENTSEMWLSSDQNVWGYKITDSLYFYDGADKTKYELTGRHDTITVLPLNEENLQQVLPLSAFDDTSPQAWLFSTEKVVARHRREIIERGKTWIEIELTLSRGEFRKAVLRVDPESDLPVNLRFSSESDLTRFVVWDFDYPASGPHDIYAMGAPIDLPIVDLRPGNDAQNVVAAMTVSRKRIGDFRMLVFSGQRVPGYSVLRRGNQWRVEICYSLPGVSQKEGPENGELIDEWCAKRFNNSRQIPLYICDGSTVWINERAMPDSPPMWQKSPQVAPQDLMSGEGLGNLNAAPGIKVPSLLFPDLSRQAGWNFDFEKNPDDMPGMVRIKRSAKLATKDPTTGHEWYTIDPARGHAVIRAELFTLPEGLEPNPAATDHLQTYVVNDLRQVTPGIWLPSSIENANSVSASSNSNLPEFVVPIGDIPDHVPAASDSNLPPMVVGRRDSTTWYSIDCNAVFSDDHFTPPVKE